MGTIGIAKETSENTNDDKMNIQHPSGFLEISIVLDLTGIEFKKRSAITP
ncbi:MAG: hypothetical protein L0Z73_00270 [Gammaproteobacteria bacterium]|nr:hypothetical protein [Gammaproteobacteria bacterium]